MLDLPPKIARALAWFTMNLDALLIGGIVAASIVALMLLLRMLGHRIVAADPASVSWKGVIGRVLAKTSILFMIAAAVNLVAAFAEPPDRVRRIIEIAFIVAAALQAAVWGRELVLGLIGRQVSEDKESTLSNAVSLIRVLVSFALFAIALIVILDNLGVNVTGLVAGLGIGGIAIGLAAQGIFSDLFAALSILFDRPFRRGDTIRYDQTTGTVEHIGLKTTRLRSLTGEQRIMANTKLLEREIHNLAAAEARRLTIYFAVTGEPNTATLDATSAAASGAVTAQAGCKLVRCVLTGLGSGALAHELVYDDKSSDNDRIAHNRSAILRALIDALGAQKIVLVRASDLPPPLAPL
jgi:small-conductance mechanosensitive channel